MARPYLSVYPDGHDDPVYEEDDAGDEGERDEDLAVAGHAREEHAVVGFFLGRLRTTAGRGEVSFVFISTGIS